MVENRKYPFIGFGLGLRTPHYDEILEKRPKEIDWFEIISENFIDAHEGYWEFLSDLSSDYKIITHGVSLNIGASDPINKEYLNKIKKLVTYLKTPWFSDHLCWTGINNGNTHDLLPLPYTESILNHVADRIKQVQDIVGIDFILENPSTYLEFDESDIPEWEFLVKLVEMTGCGLLLDVNNVYVNSFNHGYDAKKYIDIIPTEKIAQIHLAGHSNLGTHIIDTHDNNVTNEVWELYKYTIKSKGKISTMIEWDDNIPELSVLISELDKARNLS
ncbi:MAG: DUF692 domain-containing protein [Rickettsiales bacterium]